MPYKVLLTDQAKRNLRDLRKFGKKTLLQIQAALGELTHDPRGMTQELHAPLAGYRSLHMGRFRAVIRIVDKEVVVYVVAVGWHESGSREDIFQQVLQAIESGAIRIPKSSN